MLELEQVFMLHPWGYLSLGRSLLRAPCVLAGCEPGQANATICLKITPEAWRFPRGWGGQRAPACCLCPHALKNTLCVYVHPLDWVSMCLLLASLCYGPLREEFRHRMSEMKCSSACCLGEGHPFPRDYWAEKGCSADRAAV